MCFHDLAPERIKLALKYHLNQTLDRELRGLGSYSGSIAFRVAPGHNQTLAISHRGSLSKHWGHYVREKRPVWGQPQRSKLLPAPGTNDDARLLAVGGHLHQYGVSVRLEEVESGRIVVELKRSAQCLEQCQL